MQMVCESLNSYGSSVLNEKDTVSTRKQSSSSEEFCHYTPHWPNIHWKEKQDTEINCHDVEVLKGKVKGVTYHHHLPVML